MTANKHRSFEGFFFSFVCFLVFVFCFFRVMKNGLELDTDDGYTT